MALIVGTYGHETLLGTDEDDKILGLRGYEILFGFGANDLVQRGMATTASLAARVGTTRPDGPRTTG